MGEEMTFQYKCLTCGNKFELFHVIKNDKNFKQFCICPKCKNEAERQYSIFNTKASRVQA